MPTTLNKTTIPHPGKAAVLKKLTKATRTVVASTILPALKKKGATELSLVEIRKRLASLKTPLSREIITERNKN